jgi:hypothetical protein
MSSKESVRILKQTISDALLQNKPLAPSTLNTYVSLLSSLYMTMKGEGTPTEFFSTNTPVVMEAVRQKPSLNTQATINSALWILTGDEQFRSEMRYLSDTVRNEYKRQEVKRPGGVNYQMVKEIHGALMLQKQNAEKPTVRMITDCLLSGLCGGVYPDFPPRRLQDYTEMKWTNWDPTTDNYVEDVWGGDSGFRLRLQMVFNKHKTAKFEATPPVLLVPYELEGLVRDLRSIYLSEDSTAEHSEQVYLFRNDRGSKFTSASLNKRLTGIFGFSVDELRSLYLSDLHAGTPALLDMENTAKNMGHSVNAQMLFYVKKRAREEDGGGNVQDAPAIP